MRVKVKIGLKYDESEMEIIMRSLRYGTSVESKSLADAIDSAIHTEAARIANAYRGKARVDLKTLTDEP